MVIERLKLGIFCGVYSGRFTYEWHSFPSENFDVQKQAVRKQHSRFPVGFVNTLDESFQTFAKGITLPGIEWDNWSELSIVAKKALTRKN